ncbi:uncharacterized protein LOC126899993 isoform X2 [Daktulosphaira vitifoliae]|uniref:uncharacterized protein LOC126899993 isoform X2 n=2 Tax=Daktulosphaira vitifoliae TaxID=58002 RepID=UPI0021A9A99B|nr:uncharacterized protein LOC126899993 isoform X2 [Daktulosphaira vitifoliae]
MKYTLIIITLNFFFWDLYAEYTISTSNLFICLNDRHLMKNIGSKDSNSLFELSFETKINNWKKHILSKHKNLKKCKNDVREEMYLYICKSNMKEKLVDGFLEICGNAVTFCSNKFVDDIILNKDNENVKKRSKFQKFFKRKSSFNLREETANQTNLNSMENSKLLKSQSCIVRRAFDLSDDETDNVFCNKGFRTLRPVKKCSDFDSNDEFHPNISSFNRPPYSESDSSL